MKRHFYVFLLLLFSAGSGYAQESNPASPVDTADKKLINIVKLNVTSLFIGNIFIQDELSLNKWSSVCLSVGIIPSMNIASYVSIDDPDNNVKNVDVSGWNITPEYRYYVSGKGPRGFYLAPYFRYGKMSMDDFEFTYERDNGTKEKTLVSGEASQTVGGIMVGSQWRLGKRLTLDWWIAGVAFGKSETNFNGTGNFDPGQQQDIVDELRQIEDDLPLGDLDYTVTSNSIDATYDSGLPMFRGFGLCLGYIF